MTLLLPLVLSWFLGAIFLVLDGRRRRVSIAAASALVLLFVLDATLLAWLVLRSVPALDIVTGGWPQGVGIRLRVDPLSLLFGCISTGVLAAVMVHEAGVRVRSRLFPALLLLLASGLHGVFFTGDLFNFYVFFEISVMSSFALAAYGYGRVEIRGTFIYIVVNLLGTVLFLFGIAAIYHTAGTLDMEDLARLAREGRRGPFILPATLLFTALSLKLGLFPMHGWVPVLYSHARPAVAAVMSGALVNVGTYGLLRIGFSALDESRRAAAPILLVLGAAAGLYGALLAIRRKRAAEVAAYLAVVQAGYVVLALGLGGELGMVALVVAVLAGSLDKATMFLALDAPGGSGRGSSLVAGASAAGLPVTAGFVAKLQLFRAGIDVEQGWAVVTALLLSTGLVLVAMARFWRLIRDRPPGEGRGAMCLALAAASLVIGVAPGPIVEVVRQAGAGLTGAGLTGAGLTGAGLTGAGLTGGAM